MKVRIGRGRSRSDAKHQRVLSPEALALAPAFSEGRWDVPDRFNFTRDVVEVLARDPKRRALVGLGPDGVIEPRSFHQIVEGTARWSAMLRERGVEPGDRMIVVAGLSADWVEIMLAGLKIGAVIVPCSLGLPADALGIRIAASAARLVVAARIAEDTIAELAGEPDVLYTDERRGRASDPVPDAPTENTEARDVAFILSTSGTARAPRAVAHTHGSTFAARVQAEHWLDAGPRDAVWCTADSGNALAVWSTLLGPWSRGAETIVHHSEFDPAERLDLIDRLGATILCQSPSEYAALAELRQFRRYRPRRLRRLVSTGDVLDRNVIAAYEEVWGMTIHEGYGQAETGIVVANGVDTGFRMGSIGMPIVGHELAVIDDQGNVVEPGAEGELALSGRPPSLFSHYWDAPEETKAAFRGDWYVTGDIATTDEDGFVWLAGRAEDVITSRGRRFGPFRVESALRSHDAVAESAVVGIRDLERGGQFVRAFVVLGGRVEPSQQLEAELRQYATESLPEYEVPREIVFVDELPRTLGGSVRRTELRELQVVGRPLWESPEVVDPEPVVFATPEPEPEPVAHTPHEAMPPLETAEVVGLAPEPAWTPPEPVEPAPVVLDESTPIPLDEPVAIPFSEPESIPVVEPEVVALVEPEPIRLEPEPPPAEREPLRAPAPAEPEPAAFVTPESVVGESPAAPVEAAEPALLPEPDTAPEPVAPVLDPEPVALVDPLVDPAPEIGPISAEPEPAALSEPEPERRSPLEEPPPPGPLPDYVIVPGSDKPIEPGSQAPEITPLGFPAVTSLKLDRSDTPEKTEPKRKPERTKPEPEPAEKRGRRSSGEPGDDEEVGWMQGLSTRLSAYSLAHDEPPPSVEEDESTPEENGAGSPPEHG